MLGFSRGLLLAACGVGYFVDGFFLDGSWQMHLDYLLLHLVLVKTAVEGVDYAVTGQVNKSDILGRLLLDLGLFGDLGGEVASLFRRRIHLANDFQSVALVFQ